MTFPFKASRSTQPRLFNGAPLPKKFNGKPLSHWEAKAKRLIVDCLLRAADNVDDRSLPGFLTAERLRHLAVAEDADVVEEIYAEREVMAKNFARIFNNNFTVPRKTKGRKTKR